MFKRNAGLPFGQLRGSHFFRAAAIPLVVIFARTMVASAIAAQPNCIPPVESAAQQPGTLSPMLFGTNLLFNQTADDLRSRKNFMLSLTQIPVRGLRFPGGTAGDNYNWRTRATERADWFPFKYKATANDLDFDEFMSVARCLGAEPTIVLNLRSWLATGDIESGYKLAEDWVRYANIEKGYGIKYWEFGNEVYHRMPQKQTPLTASDYGRYYAELRSRLRKVDPRVELGLAIPNDRADWWDASLQGANGNVDFIVLHRYAVPNRRKLIASGSGIGETVSAVQDYMRGKLGREIPIHVTEWNIGNKASANPNLIRHDTIGHALFIADAILDLAANGVRYANYWPLVGPRDQGLLDRRDLTLNAAGLVMQMFSVLAGAHISTVELDGPDGLQLRRFSLNDGRPALAAINWLPLPQDFTWLPMIGNCSAAASIIQPAIVNGNDTLNERARLTTVEDIAPGMLTVPGESVMVIVADKSKPCLN